MKTGSALQHTPEHAKHIQYISDLFGMDDWFHAAEFLEGEKLEQALADQYRQVLQRIDPTLAIKHIPLRFEGIDKTAYYLFLTTHDGTGGLAMNRILDKGLASEFEHRQQHRLTKSEIKSGNLLMTDLLMQAESSEQPEIDEADIPSVAEEIYSICAGREMPYREVLREMVNSPYYRKDVRQAMTYLKRAGRVDYGSPLRNKDTVKFS